MENIMRNQIGLSQRAKLVFNISFMLEIYLGNIRNLKKKSGNINWKYQKIFVIEKENLDFGYGNTAICSYSSSSAKTV